MMFKKYYYSINNCEHSIRAFPIYNISLHHKFLTIIRMKKSVLGHMDVYVMVDKFHLDNIPKFTAHANITATFGKIESNHTLIHDLGAIQSRNNKGLTADKKTNKQILAKQILLNSGVAAAYYSDKNNMDMFENFNFPPKSLARQRPEILLQTTDRVILLLTDNLLELAGTGITTATIADITTARGNFIAATKEPSASRKARTVITSRINKIDKETFQLIRKELSNQMLIFIISDPVLYANYLKVIDITAEGTHKHNKPKVITAEVTVNAIHDVTEEPLEGITGKFVGKATTYTTDVNGLFKAKHPLGAGLCKLVGVDFGAKSFAFTLTEAGYSIIIRMIPTGV